MAGFNLWVQVFDKTNQNVLNGAEVQGVVQATSDFRGDAKSPVIYLTVTHDGYVPYVNQPYTAPDMSVFPIRIGLDVVPQPTLPQLNTRGHCFEQANGTRWTAIQCSDFALLAKHQNGEDITPVLKQRQAAGFNLLRVWTAFDIDGIGTFTTLDYSRIPAFVSLCASYGLYVEFTAYTGINDPQHWPNLCDAALLCHPQPLLELVNEMDQNLNEPDSQGRVFNLGDYTQPNLLLTSHGSNGSEHQPVTPHWDYATFHTNDAFEWQRKTGHNAMEIWSGPTLTNENTRYMDRSQSETMAFDAAAGAALLCAGSCFHSVNGKASVLWTPEEYSAASAWAAGARSVDLGYQDGAYRHMPELETPDMLRVYQRTLPQGAETVYIRK